MRDNFFTICLGYHFWYFSIRHCKKKKKKKKKESIFIGSTNAGITNQLVNNNCIKGFLFINIFDNRLVFDITLDILSVIFVACYTQHFRIQGCRDLFSSKDYLANKLKHGFTRTIEVQTCNL